MGKGSVLAGLDAQRRATLERLRTLEGERWQHRTGRGVSVAAVVDWLSSVDEAAAAGRVRTLDSRGPEPGAVAASSVPATSHAELLERLDRSGQRLRARLGALPALLWRARLTGDDGVRRALVDLVRLRVLREWVAMADPAFLGRADPPAPAVGRVLARASLDRLPNEVLPRLDEVPAGVLRLVVAERPGDAIAWTWGIDFARKHYGPRVMAEPDAVVRTWSGALARLLEGEVACAGLDADELSVEGDEALARTCLAALEARLSR